MDELKRGFWGYKKDSVCQYIVLLEEEASKRVAEKDARMNKLEAESQRQIAEMEAVMTTLREENRALRDNQDQVFSTMLEAQRYAEQLKADSVRQARQAQEELSAAVQKENQKLGSYVKQIQQLRAVIQGLLEEFDSKTEDVEKAMERLPAQVPGADWDRKAHEVKILFEGVPAAGAESGTPNQEKGEAWNRLSFM